jgi:hypothetical protein
VDQEGVADFHLLTLTLTHRIEKEEGSLASVRLHDYHDFSFSSDGLGLVAYLHKISRKKVSWCCLTCYAYFVVGARDESSYLVDTIGGIAARLKISFRLAA